MFEKTRDQMNHWRWDNPHAFGDQVVRSNPQKTSSGKIKRIREGYSWYGSDDLRVKIQPPSCQQYKQRYFLAVGPLYRDEIINEDDSDENWAYPRVPSGGMSRPGDGNDNDDGKGEEEMQGSGKRTGEMKGVKDGQDEQKAAEDRNQMGKATEKENGKGKGKGKWNRHGKVKGIVKQTAEGESSQSDGKATWSKCNMTLRAN